MSDNYDETKYKWRHLTKDEVEMSNARAGIQINNIVRHVLTNFPLGRITTWHPVAVRMMGLVASAGHGDHLEIGVLHGGTAIMTALVKEALGLRGDVVCIDPLDGYYPSSDLKPQGVVTERGKLLTRSVDPDTGVPISMETFQANVRYFGVGHRIRVVKAFSHPWPEELEESVFVSAYIDGDHYYDGPMNDWSNVHPRIAPGGLVWFDDCNANCPGVVRACEVARETPGWLFLELFNQQTFVLQKESHIRRAGILDDLGIAFDG